MLGQLIAHIWRASKLHAPPLLRVSITIGVALALPLVDGLSAALLHGVLPDDALAIAHARDRRGGYGGGGFGGGFGGGNNGNGNGGGGGGASFGSSRDSTPDKQSSKSKDDDRQQDRTRDRDSRDQDSDRKRDDDGRDDDRGNSGNNGGGDGGRGRGRAQNSDPQAPAVPRTVGEVIDRIIKPQLGSVPPNLFDIEMGGLMTSEILVVNSGPGLLERARQLGFGVRQTAELGNIGLSIVGLAAPPGMGAAHARSLLEGGRHNGHIAFNHVYRPYRPQTGEAAEAMPPEGSEAEAASTCAGRCYAQKIIKWQPKLEACAHKTRIGFIDASVDVDHPALAGRHIHIGNFRSDAKPTKTLQHGTSTLAVLAGGPGGTVTGLLPNSEYFAADIFYVDGRGEPVTDTLALLKAFDWMSAWNVRLINLSLAGPHDVLMQQAIEKMTHNGVIFVAAAGNDGPMGPPLYPAAYKDVIAVSAVAKDLRSYHRANRGNHIDLSAPGVAIWTAVPGGEGYQSGTSFAVPFVTAIIATVANQAVARDKNTLLASLDYKDLGEPGRDPIYGRGLILAPRRCSPSESAPLAAVKSQPTSQAGWSLETTFSEPANPRLSFTGASSLGR